MGSSFGVFLVRNPGSLCAVSCGLLSFSLFSLPPTLQAEAAPVTRLIQQTQQAQQAQPDQQKGKDDQAEETLRQTLARQEQQLGMVHIDVAQTLYKLAKVLLARGAYKQAEPMLQRTLEIEETVLGSQHPDTAASLSSLAFTSRMLGQYSRAIPLLERALVIQQNSLGSEHSHVAATLHSLASSYVATGAYDRAEPLFQQALRIQTDRTTRRATTLDSLAGLYVAKGDYAQAEPLFRQALVIWQSALGAHHPNTATTLNNLAELYREQQQYVRAEALFRQALTIWQSALGAHHPTTATAVHNLGVLLRQRGTYDEAEALFRQALTIWQTTLGVRHPTTATAVHNLGVLLRQRGTYDEADTLLTQALTVRRGVLSPDHPAVASTLHQLALLHASKGDMQTAVSLQQQANEIREKHLTLLLSSGTERQKRAYTAVFDQETNATLAFHLQAAPHNARAARLALTTTLRRKGRVLDATVEVFTRLRHSSNPDHQRLQHQLARVRSRLAALVFSRQPQLPPDQFRQKIAAYETQAQQLETQLSSHNARSHLQPPAAGISIERIQEHVPRNAALLEFVRYTPLDMTPPDNTQTRQPPDHLDQVDQVDHYAVYILAPTGSPDWVDLGPALPIDRTITAFRQALQHPSDAVQPVLMGFAQTLEAQLIRPVRPFITASSLLLISPDSQLNLLPFAALVDETGRFLIERFTLSFLTASRDLLRFAQQAPARQGVWIFADPDFNAADTPPGQTETTDRGKTAASRQFPPLAETANEARALHNLLPQAQVVTQDQATEFALKRLTGPSILHIATHGFFFARHSGTRLETLGFVELTAIPPQPTYTPIENPLLRAGLALAGANRPGLDSSDAQDGVLTALEAASLDLVGTRLVVLSACETGVGEIQHSEGVYGLRRALSIAGAESQMMSLWQVRDAATRDFMIAYYARLILGEGRAAALRNVQLQFLANADRKHPFYWASFIHAGNWTPIEGLRSSNVLRAFRQTLSAWLCRSGPSLFCG